MLLKLSLFSFTEQCIRTFYFVFIFIINGREKKKSACKTSAVVHVTVCVIKFQYVNKWCSSCDIVINSKHSCTERLQFNEIDFRSKHFFPEGKFPFLTNYAEEEAIACTTHDSSVPQFSFVILYLVSLFSANFCSSFVTFLFYVPFIFI